MSNWITEERPARLLTIEEVQSLHDHAPERGMAGDRSPAAEGYRIISGKAWRVDFGVSFKRASISFIGASPRGPSTFSSNSGRPNSLAFGKVGDGVKSADGQTANRLSVAASTGLGGKIPAAKAMPSNALNRKGGFRCCRAAVIVLGDAR